MVHVLLFITFLINNFLDQSKPAESISEGIKPIRALLQCQKFKGSEVKVNLAMD
jgi:hypothetical protein